jgi:hypothetical protein
MHYIYRERDNFVRKKEENFDLDDNILFYF